MEVLVFPNNILRKVAEKWDLKSNADKTKILKLIKDMQSTMYEANGIGLAAPQVGISKRLFIIDIDQKVEKDDEGEVISRIPGKLRVFINSKITRSCILILFHIL